MQNAFKYLMYKQRKQCLQLYSFCYAKVKQSLVRCIVMCLCRVRENFFQTGKIRGFICLWSHVYDSQSKSSSEAETEGVFGVVGISWGEKNVKRK